MKHWVAGLALFCAACVQTTETPLSSNIYQISAEGSGAIAAALTERELLKRAAQLTLEQGYTHFVLSDAQRATRSESGGLDTFPGSTIYTEPGNSVTATRPPGFAAPTYRPIKNVSVLVAMFTDSDKPKDALAAVDYLGGRQ